MDKPIISPEGMRMSNSKKIYISGSMTVEAAIVLPMFLFLFLSLFSFMEILRIQSNMLISLREIGKEMCVYGYAYDKLGNEAIENGVIPGILFGEMYVKEQVVKDIGEEEINASPIVDGVDGISFVTSSIMSNEKDIVDLRAIYYVQPDFSFVYSPKYLVCSRFYGRAWTGYDVTTAPQKEDKQTYVYITETGEVYHKTLDCRSLKVIIQAIFPSDLENRRNEYGEKYKACERCAAGNEPLLLYITADGDRYHYEKSCSGLKRTIYTVPLSEVGNRTPCRRCH